MKHIIKKIYKVDWNWEIFILYLSGLKFIKWKTNSKINMIKDTLWYIENIYDLWIKVIFLSYLKWFINILYPLFKLDVLIIIFYLN